MRPKKGFVLREIAGQAVVIATGEASRSFHGMVKLNETGKKIFNGLADRNTPEEIAEKIVAQYEQVTYDQALADVRAMIAKMDEAGILE